MREILFKAKELCSTGERKWIYGYLMMNQDGSNVFIVERPKANGQQTQNFNPISVDGKTVCQYTGIKDRNGTKVFEGDIIKDSNGYKAVIAFDKDSYQLRAEYVNYDYEYDGRLLKTLIRNSTVIGNIHDDQEEKKGKMEENGKSATEIIEEVIETICNDFCKYGETSDENGECEYMRKHSGKCPLDRLN